MSEIQNLTKVYAAGLDRPRAAEPSSVVSSTLLASAYVTLRRRDA